MASSFADQIPTIVYVVSQLRPRRVLDIGKGFGKYGFLIHEYTGIDPKRAPKPTLTMREQSGVQIDTVDINPDYNFPHLSHLYTQVINGNIVDLYPTLTGYDLVLMADVIEHLPKKAALKMIEHWIAAGAKVLVSTPATFFQQDLYESEAERHQSFWTRADFRSLGCHVESQRVGAGIVYLLSSQRVQIPGFGRTLAKRLRRVARAIINELG